MIAYCGLSCDTCSIHLATLEQDPSRQQAMRESIAKICSEKYGMNLQAAEVNDCDGCRATAGRLFSGCLTCKVRECASRKKIINCAYCNDYACTDLKAIFKLDPEAQARLESEFNQ